MVYRQTGFGARVLLMEFCLVWLELDSVQQQFDTWTGHCVAQLPKSIPPSVNVRATRAAADYLEFLVGPPL